jgi:hypothetical protein
MPDGAAERLSAYYAPQNERLFALEGDALRWDTAPAEDRS